MDLRPGTIVYGLTNDDQYEIIRPIGNGAFGVVYEVRNKEGLIFALKTIITAWVNNDGLQMLLNEGKLTTEVRHDNILRVFYFHDGRQYPNLPPYIIMEYADGGTLQDCLDEKRRDLEYFNTEELREIFYQLASGMKALNEKLVHRDIKPDNILFVNNILKISDFGLSKVVAAATRSKTLKGINHLKYCAPEAWRLEKNTPAMDMYSMGIVFYEIATLEQPYDVGISGDVVEAWKNAHILQQAKDPRLYNANLDLGLYQLIMKMIYKRPQDRYTTWDEIIQRLQSISAFKESSRDVSSLLVSAIESHRKAEQARLKTEEEITKRKEYEGIIEYCFEEIYNAGKEIVDAFNLQSDFTKLSIGREKSDLSYYISVLGRAGGKPVIIIVKPVYENIYIENKLIKAWGLAKSPYGKGFNLLLISTEPEDLYGQWMTFHVTHNPLVLKKDRRLEPFPFEIRELPNEIKNLNAIHIYQVHQDIFKTEMLESLIQELF